MSAPTAVSPRARRRSLRVVALVVVVGAAAVGIVWLALPYVTLSPDARYELAWGVQLAHGDVPDFADPSVSTPHPLPLALGTLLSPLGQGAAIDLYSIVSVAAFALLLYAAFRLGRALGGHWAGLLALVVVATRPRIDFFAAHGFVDIPFAALVLLAAAIAAERPRGRSPGALGLLAGAGLLRPEAWGMSILYASWLAWGWRADAERVRKIVVAVFAAVAAPLTWMALDLVFSGDPLLSVSGTEERGAVLARPTGLGHLLPELRDGFDALVGWPLALAGAAMGVWALARFGAGRGRDGLGRKGAAARAERVPSDDRSAFALAGALVLAGGGAFAALAVADLPLNDRYLIVPALALVALATSALPLARRSPVAALALGLALVGVVAAAPDDLRRTDRTLELAHRKHDADGDLERLLGRADVRADLRRCRGLVVSGTARPSAAVALERDPADLPRSTGPLPDSGQAAISTSDTVNPRARGAVRLGAWTYVSRC